MKCPRSLTLAALATAALCPASALADQTLTFDGTVDPSSGGGLDHVAIPFSVPAGIAEIEVDHTVPSTTDILDWGLTGPNGFRGWGGGNKEPAIVGEVAASRSYLTGPITAGTWQVNIGKAKLINPPVSYHVVVTLRTAPTLAPQTERKPYAPIAPLSTTARWYAGDLHAHSRESGDAQPTIDDLVTFARQQGLDFIELSDHNTVSQLDFIDGVQANHSDILILPGVEFTTYAGHANGIGATTWVDHKIGQPGVTIDGAAQAFHDQGALFSINHPLYDLGPLCIGCAWKHQLAPTAIDAVEIVTAGSGTIFGANTLAWWDNLCATGRHIPAVSGSDDHSAGKNIGAFGTPVGVPTTYVYATELSAAGILAGIRSGQTVVKFNGVNDPMVEISSEVPKDGDTIRAEATTLHAKITGGTGLTAHWVVNGVAGADKDISKDPFDLALTVNAPKTGQDRYRVEVYRAGQPTTVTSHVWLEYKAGVGAQNTNANANGGGCELRAPANGRAVENRGWLVVFGALGIGALLVQRRRRNDRGE